MAENTSGQGGVRPEDYPRTVTDGSSAVPPQAPPFAYTPTETYPQTQPQPPSVPQPEPVYGGYGYPGPQTPPPGAYPQQGGYPAQGGGYPQQGPYPGQEAYPAQAGYPGQEAYPAAGYPQQAEYQQQGGYPPPNGYGQGGYGQGPAAYYPQQGGYPPVPAPRQGIGKGAVFGILGGVLALIAATVVAVVVTTGDNGGGGGGGGGGGTASGTTLKQAWSLPGSGSSDRLVGSWLTATTLVRASSGGGVAGYNISTGAKVWTATAPTDATVPCGMSPTVNAEGVGTIAFGTDRNSCKYVAGVMAGTGVVLWKVNLMDSNDTVAMSAQTFLQGTVATILSHGRAAGFDAITGKRVWLNTARGQSCNETAYGTAGVVVIDDFCADVSPEKTLTALNASTGKRLWRTTESDHVLEGNVLNGSPLVAALTPQESSPVAIYDSAGKSTPLDMTGLSLTGSWSGGTTAIKLAGSTLVVQSSTNGTADDSTGGQVIAYDLGDGHQLWRYNGESAHGAVLAQPTADGKLYALSTGTYSGSPHFVQLDPVTGKSTILGALDSSADGWLLSDGTIYALPGGGVLSLNNFGSTGIPAVSVYK